MGKVLRLITLLSLGLLILNGCGGGNTSRGNNSYYVAMDGNDSNPGTIDRPWCTFAKAVSAAGAGDTVYVRAGIYHERLILEKSGAPGAWLTFMAYPGETVTIDGAGIEIEHIWGGLIHISRLSYIKIEGFRLSNSVGAAIFACDSSHITIANNHTYNSGNPGIHVWYDNNLVIAGNEVEMGCMNPDSGLECISLRTVDTFRISNNHVHHGKSIGIDVAEGCANGVVFSNKVDHQQGLGIYLDAWNGQLHDVEVFDNISHDNEDGLCVNSENGGTIERIKVYRNRACNNSKKDADNIERAGRGFIVGWGGVPGAPVPVRDVEFYGNVSSGNGNEGFVIYGVKAATIERIKIHNNLIYGNKGSGIHITGIVDYPNIYTIRDITVINNTIHKNGSEAIWGSGGIFLSNTDNDNGRVENITIRNNIISENHVFSVAVWPWGTAPTGVVIDHSLIDGYRNASNYGETYGADTVIDVPSFMDPFNNDLHLLSNSAAIDKASADNVPTTDFDGTSRPQGNGYDIGAFEYKP